MTRICFTMGPAQLLFMCASLRQESKGREPTNRDVLVLYGYRLSAEIRRVMMLIAQAAWPWEKIVWAEDVLDYDRLRRETNWSALGREVRRKVELVSADEIWVCRVAGRPEQAAMAAYPDARIVLCDDGVATYVEEQKSAMRLLAHPKRTLREAKHLALRVRTVMPGCQKGAWYRWPVKPISRAYLLLANMLPVPRRLKNSNVVQISSNSARAVIEDVRRTPGFDFSGTPNSGGVKRVLLLGQCFSKWGTISWGEEYCFYERLCSRLDQVNCEVIWKEHPKNNRPFLSLLQKRKANVKPLTDMTRAIWPIEFIGDQLGVTVCLSATSTSLFTLRILFGIPTYTFARDVIPFFRKRRQAREMEVARLVANNLPPVDAFLDSDAIHPRMVER